MDYRTNLAYDSSQLERVPRIEPQPPIRKVGKRRKEYLQPHKAILLILIAVAITSSVVYSMVQMTELTDELNTLSAEYQTQKSESVRLNVELDTVMSLSNLEKYAETELGLVKMDKSQVEYINLSQGNIIEIPEPETITVFEKIKSAFTNFVEYLVG